MSEKKDYTHIHKDIYTSQGTSGGGRLYVSVNTITGKSEVVIEQTIKHTMPVTEIVNAVSAYESLNVKSGRPLITISDLLEIT